jgi:hypothetical protein
LDLLYSIKMAHKHKKFKNSDHGFWKTAVDIHRMRSVGTKIREEYNEFYKLREKESLNYKHPSLNMNKEGFFSNNGITQIFEHDDLHIVMAFGEAPAYTKYLKDGSEVLTDKNKFFAVDESVRLAGVIQEALVLSLERSQIPYKGLWTPEQSFRFALAKVCTSITSGYFRKYAFDNCFKVLKEYPKNYVEKFWKDLETGKVRYIDG